MNTTFHVQWRLLFRSLSIFMTIAIAIPVTLTCAIRIVRLGWNGAFTHVSPLAFAVILLGIPVFSILFAFPIALLFKLASVTVTDAEVVGRNFWGRKARIPLSDITGFERFSNNGINAVVVTSKNSGKVFIYEHTECIQDLLALLSTYIPETKNHGA